jgi:hypothetical protein
MQEYAKGFKTNPPSKERIKLFEKFDQVLHVSHLNIVIVVATFQALAISIDNKKITNEDLLKLIRQIKPAVVQSGAVSFFYIYKDISDEDQLKYINDNDTKPMHKLMGVLSRKLQLGFSDWGKSMGEKIKKLKSQVKNNKVIEHGN